MIGPQVRPHRPPCMKTTKALTLKQTKRMLVLQQNCGKGYEYTISMFEAVLGLEAFVVCIQEPFLGNCSLAHVGFNLYWPVETNKQKDMGVLIAVKKDILNKVFIEIVWI